MGKRSELCYYVALLFTTLVLLLPPVQASDFLTGEVITGKATASSFGIGVTVVGTPSVTITRPENKTYLVTRLEVQYSTGGGSDNENYSIDGGAEVAISGNTNITFSTGTRHLQMWANNSYGSGTDEVYFTIDPTLLTINYTDYNGSRKGDSTKFYDFAYEDLQVLNITLEDTEWGKIVFNATINITADANFSDGNVDLDTHTNITDSSATVDTSALPNFNTSATISLYNLSFTNPQIQLDGSECSDTICSTTSYSSGTLIFTVTQLGTYTVIETPEEETPPASSGGGGGGGSDTTVFYDFDIISPGVIEVGLNDEIVIPIYVVNNEEDIVLKNVLLNVTPSDPALDPELEYTFIEELLPGQNETVLLFISSDAELGNYEIELTADVESPIIKESETLFLKTVEVIGKVEVLERILLAQELFKENPECLELNDLLIQAQELVEQNRITQAKTLVQEAILKCRDLVTNKEFPNPPRFGRFDAWRTPIEITLILIIITFIILSLVRRKHKLNLESGKATKKKGKGILGSLFSRSPRKKKPKKKSTKKTTTRKSEPIEPMQI